MIELKHITAGYQGGVVLRDVSLTIPAGRITTLIGPNGCGKTTLLRVAARQLTPSAGQVLTAGRPAEDYDRREFARFASLMPQVRDVPAITVESLVAHGRFPYLGLSRRMRPEDRQKVAQAMQAAGVEQWRGRDLRELSGGERQRAYIAMALAQDTQIILLDEPTTYLDLGVQFEILSLLQRLNKQGKTIVMVLHDLSQALEVSDRIIVIKNGRKYSEGSPLEVITPQMLHEVYNVECDVLQIPGRSKPLLAFKEIV